MTRRRRDASARVLVHPLAALDRAFAAGLVDAPLARELRIDDQRPVDLDTVVVGERCVERCELAEHAGFRLREIDLRMQRGHAARVDRGAHGRALGQ
ncbi:hypothetical protein BvRS1_15360 [Burkholderia vietnamiensis]|nr:hypothetical protein BvRS1_15360 [Burkholderia vietnamiensis]